MLKISNIPNEVYLVALDHMGVERPASATDAEQQYEDAVSRVDYVPITARRRDKDICRLSAFGLAMAQYLSLSGPFNEEDGEFAGLNGYEVAP